MYRTLAALAAALALSVGAASAADNPEVTLAIPANSTDFAFAYIAQDLGFWQKAGVDVNVNLIPGLGSANALFGGSVEFAAGSGATAVVSSARGQHPLVVAAVRTKLPFDIIASKALAASVDLNADTATRARALKGKVIGIDRPGTFQHGFAKYVLALAGLDPEKDATYAPIAPPAMPAALEAGKVDAFSAPPPWSTLAVDKGIGVTLISPPNGDIPELSSLAALLITTRADYCPAHADTCRKFLAGVKAAMEFVDQHPEEAFEVVKKKFQDMDATLLEVGFKDTRASYNTSLEISEDMLKNAEILSLQGGSIKPEEKRQGSFAEFYSNDYLH